MISASVSLLFFPLFFVYPLLFLTLLYFIHHQLIPHFTFQLPAPTISSPTYVSLSLSHCSPGVDLSGPSRRTRRLRLYAYLMEGLSEEHKITATARVLQDILAHALETSVGAYTPQFVEALEDAFLILQSPLLRVGRRGGAGGGVGGGGMGDGHDGHDDELEASSATATAAALDQAKTTVLKKLSVQHLVGHILPVVTALKRALEGANSRLQRPLMEYLVSLVKHHKTEVTQALSHDPTLKVDCMISVCTACICLFAVGFCMYTRLDIPIPPLTCPIPPPTPYFFLRFWFWFWLCLWLSKCKYKCTCECESARRQNDGWRCGRQRGGCGGQVVPGRSCGDSDQGSHGIRQRVVG